MDTLNIYLEPGLVGRVAAGAFGLDPARLTVPPLDGLDVPQLRAAMGAVGAELTSGGAGGPLAAESLANVLAVHLIRHVLSPRRPGRGPDGALPRGRPRAVVEYVEEHLDAGPSQGADGCGRPPQSLLLRAAVQGGHRAAAAPVRPRPPRRTGEAAPARRRRPVPGGGPACAGFSDQGQFYRHFKRLVGVTPGQFRKPARIA
jgi:AraC family transcriptional regulator